MKIDYTANNTFAKVHRDANPYLFIRGPVGSGKSSGCIMHLFMNAMLQQPDQRNIRRSRYAVIRSTYPALKTTVVKSWKDWFEDRIKIVFDVPIRGNIEMELPDGTSMDMEIIFIALDREDNINKLQSLELTGAHINEAAEIAKPIFDMLKTRIRRYPSSKNGGPTHSFIILDYNSVGIDHWLYKFAEEEKPIKHSFYSQPPALLWNGSEYVINPDADNLGHYDSDMKWVKHLEPDYYLDMVAGNDDDFVSVYVLNNYGSLRQGRPVYKAYEDKYHATSSIIKPYDGLPLIIGMDCGLTPAAAFCQLSPIGQLIVFDELVTENTSIQEFANDHLWSMIHNKYRKFSFEVIVDPAARTRSQNDKRSAMELLISAGIPVRIAKTNESLARREAVNFFLRKRDGLLISGTNCPVIRKGFISEYKFAKVSQSDAFSTRFKEKPEKNIYSHVHDALQYAAVELSEGRTLRNKKSKHHATHTSPADSSSGY